MRDHTKLLVFHLGDRLLDMVYDEALSFPKDKQYILVSQMKRSALSVPSNIVEGCARSSIGDYAHFLTIAYASSRELQYQLSFAARCGFLTHPDDATQASEDLAKALNALVRSVQLTKNTGQ